jgi:transcriptional regulator with XRE-family HTH domain
MLALAFSSVVAGFSGSIHLSPGKSLHNVGKAATLCNIIRAKRGNRMSAVESQEPTDVPSAPVHPSQALAANLRRLRALRRLSQDDVAERMTVFGYGRGGTWARTTAAEAEAGKRQVTVDELIGLALIFGSTIGELLDPGKANLALGDAEQEGEPEGAPLRQRLARPFVRSDIALELTEHAPGRFTLRTLKVEGRDEEYLKAIGARREPGEE